MASTTTKERIKPTVTITTPEEFIQVPAPPSSMPQKRIHKRTRGSENNHKRVQSHATMGVPDRSVVRATRRCGQLRHTVPRNIGHLVMERKCATQSILVSRETWLAEMSMEMGYDWRNHFHIHLAQPPTHDRIRIYIHMDRLGSSSMRAFARRKLQAQCNDIMVEETVVETDDEVVAAEMVDEMDDDNVHRMVDEIWDAAVDMHVDVHVDEKANDDCTSSNNMDDKVCLQRPRKAHHGDAVPGISTFKADCAEQDPPATQDGQCPCFETDPPRDPATPTPFTASPPTPTVWSEEMMPDKRKIAVLDFPTSQSHLVFAEVIAIGCTLDAQMEHTANPVVGLACGAEAVDTRLMHWLPIQPTGPVVQTFWMRPDYQRQKNPLPEIGTREYTMLMYNELEHNANPTNTEKHAPVSRDMSVYTQGVLTRVLDSIDSQTQRRRQQIALDRAEAGVEVDEEKEKEENNHPVPDLYARIAAQKSAGAVANASTGNDASEHATAPPRSDDTTKTSVRDAAIAGDPTLALFDQLPTGSDGAIPNDAEESFGDYVGIDIKQTDADKEELDAMMASTLLALDNLFIDRCGPTETSRHLLQPPSLGDMV
jgi:hypothetical protein